MSDNSDNNEKIPNLVKLAAQTKEGKQALIITGIALLATVVIAIVSKYTAIHFLVMAIPGFAAMAGTQQFANVANAIRMGIADEEEERKRNNKA